MLLPCKPSSSQLQSPSRHSLIPLQSVRHWDRSETFRHSLNPLARKGFDDSAIWNDIQIADYLSNKAGVNKSGTADRLLPAILGAGGLGAVGGILGN